MKNEFCGKSGRGGFTIVEMLMVIGVLAVLVGIVTTAASASIRQARDRRREALRQVLQTGVATFYAQEGEWPGKIENQMNNATKDKPFVFAGRECDAIFQDLVNKSNENAKKGNPYLDVSGLFVAESGVADRRAPGGHEYREAVAQNKKRGKTLSVSSMAFGYPGKKTGKFCRFSIICNPVTDTVKVSPCCDRCCNGGSTTKANYEPGACTDSNCKYCHDL